MRFGRTKEQCLRHTRRPRQRTWVVYLVDTVIETVPSRPSTETRGEQDFFFPKLLAVLQAPSPSVSELISSLTRRNVEDLTFYDNHLGTFHTVRAIEDWFRLPFVNASSLRITSRTSQVQGERLIDRGSHSFRKPIRVYCTPDIEGSSTSTPVRFCQHSHRS